ncbi:uncharacterized protein EM151A_1805 [Enterococcus mundtii]|uniref:Uncharacterized protein n=1 Tax=Enterococcus mundtii TaxID=53346 RepID=A0AAI8R9V5_ENTMU|nr:uncharacterized protein EM151A_1805 [Enterococcus mundtii]
MLKDRLNRLSYSDGFRVFKLFNFALTVIFYRLCGIELALIYILSNISVCLIALEIHTRPKEVSKDESQRTDDQ